VLAIFNEEANLHPALRWVDWETILEIPFNLLSAIKEIHPELPAAMIERVHVAGILERSDSDLKKILDLFNEGMEEDEEESDDDESDQCRKSGATVPVDENGGNCGDDCATDYDMEGGVDDDEKEPAA
jgi:hypothetical protein